MVNTYDRIANLAYHAARSGRQTLIYDAPMEFWRDFVSDQRVMHAITEPLQPDQPFPWFGVDVKVRIIKPCGGCGQPDPEKRCLGCRHVFIKP